MNKRNIWTETTEELQVHEDIRGKIADLFYNHPINHISFLITNADGIRGNHYHKQTTQHLFLIRGELEYWYKPAYSNDKAEMIRVAPGDIVTSSPLEIHVIKALKDSEFIALSEGLRGGKDYESDTFRVQSIIPYIEK